MKIIFADADTLGNDISLESFQTLGEVILYGHTKPEELSSRCNGADILITNKVPVNETTLGSNPSVRYIGVTATGTNIIDLNYTKSKQIAVTNVKGYSTQSVAQHTFALLFYLLEKSYYYDQYVKTERYVNDTLFTHFENKFHELSQKTWGIVGLGEIGKQVADIAKAFGCSVIYYSTSGKNQNPNYQQTDFPTLLKDSDIISIHAPLTPATQNLFNRDTFSQMKPSSILINVGRGPIIDEAALYEALTEHQIMAAGLDVLSVEPMSKENPLVNFKDSSRLIITPHIAWATVEARTRLMQEVFLNLQAYLKGTPRNLVL
ncbi:MAG: D-2-hydroxyacid dehydrogenase [Lachnospiraceae bacterium]|nr:D-2-hydroxyacid dehydrogenase [Lachnospiraceae bacterium]